MALTYLEDAYEPFEIDEENNVLPAIVGPDELPALVAPQPLLALPPPSPPLPPIGCRSNRVVPLTTPLEI